MTVPGKTSGGIALTSLATGGEHIKAREKLCGYARLLQPTWKGIEWFSE